MATKRSEVPEKRVKEHRSRPSTYQMTSIRAQYIFAREYYRTGNRMHAYRTAFPDHPQPPENMRTSASKLLASPKVQQIINRIRQKTFARVQSSVEELVAENLAIVRFDPARIFDEDGELKPWSEIEEQDRRCIGEVKIDVSYDKEGNKTRITTIKRQDRGPALDRLARIMGAYAKDNAQKADAAVIAGDPLQTAQRIAFILNQAIRAKQVTTIDAEKTT